MRKSRWVLCVLALVALLGCAGDRDQPGARAGATPAGRTTAPHKGSSVQPDGSSGSAVIGRRGPDGAITTECVDGAHAAEAFARADAAAPIARRGQR